MGKRCVYSFQKDWSALEAVGVPLEPPEFRLGSRSGHYNKEIFIEQVGDMAGNSIMEVGKYNVAYVLELRIINRFPGTAHIIEYWLELPWADRFFQWLPDPMDNDPENAFYLLPECHLYYPRGAVINHHIQKPLRSGDVLEGLLLGRGCELIGKQFAHGAEIGVKLKLIDQWDRCHSADLVMSIFKDASLRKPRSRTHDSLWTHRDPVPLRSNGLPYSPKAVVPREDLVTSN